MAARLDSERTVWSGGRAGRRLALWVLVLCLVRVAGAQADGHAVEMGQAVRAIEQQRGTISGTVVDSDGDAVVGATVTLASAAGSADRRAVTDGQGYFSFLEVSPGSSNVTVSAAGFAVSSRAVTLRAGEDLETPDVVLKVASANADVEVSFTQHDLAEEQMKTEEKQRIGGVIPNFYVTYNWKSAPLTAGQKFKLAFRSIIDPENFALAAIVAGIEQGGNAFSGYGPGPQGYGKRYGAALADGAVGTVVGGAILPALLRQDPRYFYKGTGSVWSRALYAVSTAVICRGDNGRWQPNYSGVAGDVAAGAISNAYYPATDRSGALLTVENGLLNAAEDGFGNLLQEFVFKWVTPGARKKP